MLDPGVIGSPADVGTFVLVLYGLKNEIRSRMNTLAAGIVALAASEPTVDEDRLKSELDVEDDDIDAVRPRVYCGGQPLDEEAQDD